MAREGDQRDHPTRGIPQIFKGGKWVNKRSSKSSTKGNRDSEFQSKKNSKTITTTNRRGRKVTKPNPNYKPEKTNNKKGKPDKPSTEAVWNSEKFQWEVPANVKANKAHKAKQEADRLKIKPKRELNLKEVSKYSGKDDKKDSYQTMQKLYSKSDSEKSDTQRSGSNVTTPKKKEETWDGKEMGRPKPGSAGASIQTKLKEGGWSQAELDAKTNAARLRRNKNKVRTVKNLVKKEDDKKNQRTGGEA